MNEPFKPFVQVSRNRLASLRNVLSDGAGDLYLQCIIRMDEHYLIVAQDIMPILGIKHTDSFRRRCIPLEQAGLIQPFDHLENGALRYRVNPHYVKFFAPKTDFCGENPIDRSIFSDSGLTNPNEFVEENSQQIVLNTTARDTLVDNNPRLPFEPEIPEAERYRGYNPFMVYESELYGQITPTVGDRLGDLASEFGDWTVVKALVVGSLNNVRKWNYLVQILVNWRDGKETSSAGEWQEIMS